MLGRVVKCHHEENIVHILLSLEPMQSAPTKLLLVPWLNGWGCGGLRGFTSCGACVCTSVTTS